jgi:hypothetical protein
MVDKMARLGSIGSGSRVRTVITDRGIGSSV